MPLTTEARADLLAALQPLVADLAEDLRARLVDPPGPRERAARAAAARLYEEETVGEAFDVWLDLLGHRAAVLQVLKLVYVRVLEDRGLIRPRILDPARQSLFERLAPSLGESAFLRWVFADLAEPRGGLPELFSPQPAEVLAPTDAHARALLALFREKNVDTGVLRFDFSDERFDGQLLGDLYQELDPVVKKRFALLQTPSFVRRFMLDRTLSEALAHWPADAVRLIDPACGSGHFLIDALRRLTEATAAQHPDWSPREVVAQVLPRIVGTDLNDYAAGLARARLLMTALELAGETGLDATGTLRPQVYWADGLEQLEREATDDQTQMLLGVDPAAIPRASLTPGATKRALRPLLKSGFHVVVANPPYITEKDKARKRYHKEKVGSAKRPRYISASGKYALGSPFTERCFQLAVDGGFVGIINSNSFAKRTFGVALVEQVLAKKDLSLVVDTSGAYIPGHGTPTILVFARNQAPEGDTFTAVLGKRGEPSSPTDPAKGKVWSAIERGWDTPDFDSPWVSAEAVHREWFGQHPWSLRGGGALGVQHQVEALSGTTLGDIASDMGFDAITGADEVFLADRSTWGRRGVTKELTRDLVEGVAVRDWRISPESTVGFPYQGIIPVPIEQHPALHSSLWRHKRILSERKQFGKTALEAGLQWFEYRSFYTSKRYTDNTITFAFVATHNHFVLDRGGKVFNRTAPVVKLPATATIDDHLALLGPLNSSTACFWMKQAFFCKGGQGVNEGHKSESWEQFYEHDSTKLARFPLPPNRSATVPHARALDRLGHARAADTVSQLLDDPGWSSPAELRALLDARRARDLDRLEQMVALQEELDWLCYRLYGIVDDSLPVRAPDETPPLRPGLRPFELALARSDAAARAAIAAGEDTDEVPTAWFERHGWTPATALPDSVDAETAALFAARAAATEASAALQLLEAPVHKRRWYRPDFDKDETGALQAFLLERIEEALAAEDEPQTPRALARQLAQSPRFRAAAALFTGAEAPELDLLCAQLMEGDSVPAHPLHRYTKKGLVKRRAWETTWALQEREDRGETVKIKVPPKYTGADFLSKDAYKLRGSLDVPKERFVAFTEVPTATGGRRTGPDALYGWAGWSRAERLDRLEALLEELDDEGVPNEERTALFDTMFRYVRELARTAPAEASDRLAELRYSAPGTSADGPTAPQLAAWLKAHPAKGDWA